MDLSVTDTVLLEPEKYYKEARSKFIILYNTDIDRFSEAEKSIRILLSRILQAEGLRVSKVVSRVKDRDECIKKFDRKYRDSCENQKKKYNIISHLTDLIGLRVVCFYESDVDLVKKAIENHLVVEDTTDKRIAENPNEFGYKGLHLDVKIDEKRAEIVEYSEFKDLKFEVQIRTIVQDAWSEVDHKLQYKRQIPTPLKRKINALAALFEMADRDFLSIRDDTNRQIEESREVIKEDKNLQEPLDAISFSTISEPFFDGFQFFPGAADGFVTDIKNEYPDITKADYKNILSDNIDNVKDYRKYLTEELGNHGGNPITMIRFCLYLSNRSRYENILFPGLRKNIDRWSEWSTVIPSEIEAIKNARKSSDRSSN